MNKSFLTNMVAGFTALAGLFPIYNEFVFFTGLFALSGSITNWFAIYMLFDKVPGIYGSGVIPRNFTTFKTGIKEMVVKEFFNGNSFEKFVRSNQDSLKAEIQKKLNFDKIFLKFTEAIDESSLGGLLEIIGGKKALDPLKEPFRKKLVIALSEQFESWSENQTKGNEEIKEKLERLIEDRLNEIGPNEVKLILKKMISKHLGWLVVWGGVFGAVIGLLSALVLSEF